MNNKDFQNGLIIGLAKGGNINEGSSVQPDYLQNDPNAKDYIKNRPFYDDNETIHKLDDKYLNYADDEDIIEILTDLQLVTPVTLNNEAILISNNNEIYSL